MSYSFKNIQTVQDWEALVDTVFSSMMKKTPTIVRKGYEMSRIRSFYLRKVKYGQTTFVDKLEQIINDFPRLDDIHPFYADLINIIYDRDHYKLALGQVNIARNTISTIGKEYCKLLKYGDSLYRCKRLKIAALGRMATVIRRQKACFEYLENVRQHLARLPSIDPNTRTLLLCGYPNVGKSSFISKVTRAQVEVQPYAFTTKSLYVGHMDYNYLRWQVIDTPGILDHPLEDRNTIEMQSIIALAHIRACVLFFIDASEMCGYSLEEQISLFNSIKPLFNNKPIIMVANKKDVKSLDELSDDYKEIIEQVRDSGITILESSCSNDEGLMDVRNHACDVLLETRIQSKLRNKTSSNILDRLHVAKPSYIKEDRPKIIPPNAKAYAEANSILKELELEAEGGGAGVYSADLRKSYLLEEDEWKYDNIPEIMDGKNILDFIDPSIQEKLVKLVDEEDEKEKQGVYDASHLFNEEEYMFEKLSTQAEDKRKVKVLVRHATSHRGNSMVPRPQMIQSKRAREMLESDSSDGDDDEEKPEPKRVMKLGKPIIDKVIKRAQLPFNRDGRKGMADRHIYTKKPQHLFSGKRKSGSTSRR